MYPPLSISADEVNYLVYRYLVESGLRHSTFAFEHESMIGAKLDKFRAMEIRPGMLITLMHKALQLMQVEMHMEEDGTERECEAPLSLLYPHSCRAPADVHLRAAPISSAAGSAASGPTRTRKGSESSALKDIDPTSKMSTKERRRKERKEKAAAAAKEKEARRKSATAPVAGTGAARSRTAENNDDDAMDVDEPAVPPAADAGDEMDSGPGEGFDDILVQVNVAQEGDEPPTLSEMEDKIVTVRSPKVQYHLVAWNPVENDLFASCSLNAIAGIFTVPLTTSQPPAGLLLPHPATQQPPALAPNATAVPAATTAVEVTAMAWSPCGQYLATGTRDARVRVFSRSGELLVAYTAIHRSSDVGRVLHAYVDDDNAATAGDGDSNPILDVAFSPDSALVASASGLGGLVIWNIAKDVCRCVAYWSEAVMAIAWYAPTQLACGLANGHVYFVDAAAATSQPLHSQHGSPVNQLAWDPVSHKLLASCSDDGTICVWAAETEPSSSAATATVNGTHTKEPAAVPPPRAPPRLVPQAVLTGHDGPVVAMDWNPRPPNSAPQLASIGLDSTVRIWDVTTANCIYTMERFVESHSTLRYSPDGQRLICSSDDRYLTVWSAAGANVLRRYYGRSDITDVQFSKSGDRIAVCFGRSRIAVVGMPPLPGESTARGGGARGR
ncbi:WD40-repeat-containing domain protein [Blastocladiella britannica]|nr:WD40-repeat-containing domain protein [Blastocladiella britannica]